MAYLSDEWDDDAMDNQPINASDLLDELDRDERREEVARNLTRRSLGRVEGLGSAYARHFGEVL